MKYIVYLTKNCKNTVNGLNLIYIGVHATNDPSIFDGYIGCGVYKHQPSTYMYPKTPFQYAVKKYGVDAFERVVLFIYDDEISAYKKEAELVDLNFIKQAHVYNACIGGDIAHNYKKLYQFDLTGKLQKVWDFSIEAYEFFGYPLERFEYAIHHKHPFLDSLWGRSPVIDITEYSTKLHGNPRITYLYSKDGKFLSEFYSQTDCSEYLGVKNSTITKAVVTQQLIKNNYYVSETLVDLFLPKPRIKYSKEEFYLYDDTNKFLGKYLGKEIMPIINLYSWRDLSDVLKLNNGWYKNYYISLEMINQIPEKQFVKSIRVDVFDKYGNFIETLNTVKEVREKYKVPSSKIKNLEMGDRYFDNYIFKYHRIL